MQVTTEIWNDIPGYEGFYQASTFGRIRGVDRLVKMNIEEPLLFKGKILRGKIDKDGYIEYSLCKESSTKSIKCHILIALTFIPNPESKLHVNHKDGNKFHNFPDNLEWATPSENMQHAYDTGLRFAPHRKKVDQYTLCGSFVRRWDCLEDVIRAGVARKPGECAQGKIKHSGGFTWKYA